MAMEEGSFIYGTTINEQEAQHGTALGLEN